jgi:chromosomal replication initiator protein
MTSPLDRMNVQVVFGGYRLQGVCLRKLPRLRRVTVSEIQEAVSEHYRLPAGAMTSADRRWEISHPRQLAMYLCRDMIGRSLPDIGRRFGGRDHTTVIHALRAIPARLEDDFDLQDDVRRIRVRLGS